MTAHNLCAKTINVRRRVKCYSFYDRWRNVSVWLLFTIIACKFNGSFIKKEKSGRDEWWLLHPKECNPLRFNECCYDHISSKNLTSPKHNLIWRKLKSWQRRTQIYCPTIHHLRVLGINFDALIYNCNCCDRNVLLSFTMSDYLYQ